MPRALHEKRRERESMGPPARKGTLRPMGIMGGQLYPPDIKITRESYIFRTLPQYCSKPPEGWLNVFQFH